MSLQSSLLCRVLAWLTVSWSFAGLGHAQTSASCTFSFFQTSFKGGLQLTPFGINDFSTVVGALNSPKNNFQAGFIRWANGGVTPFVDLLGPSLLFSRNDKGVSTGLDHSGAITLSHGNVAPIAVTIGPNTFTALNAFGINRWGTIVGEYGDTGGVNHGFKRFSNGHGVTLDFPNAVDTFARAINDNGTIVGTIGVSPLTHGFIYHNGSWAKLNYPKADATTLVGISDAGMIIGNADFFGSFTGTPFIYQNGIFKKLSIPHASSYVAGISLKLGLIVGLTSPDSGGHRGFIAKCN